MVYHLPTGVRQIRAGMYGTVTYEDRHVSEPRDPVLLDLAEALSTLDTASRLEELMSLLNEYDIDHLELLEHYVWHWKIKRKVAANEASRRVLH